MNKFLFLCTFLMATFSQAQLTITPALTDGELRLSKSLTYVYIKNNGSTSVSVPILLSSSSGSTSSGGAVVPDFYVKTIGLGSFSYNATSNIFYSWGMNYQSGYNVAFKALSPVALNLNSTLGQSLKLITAGQNHACGVGNTNNALYCWGYGLQGQLGNGLGTNSNQPVLASTP